MASILTQRDRELLSAGNKIRIGNKPYENGVFGSRENRDFVFFQLSDNNGNIIEFRNLPFSQINLKDNGNLELQPPQHFIDSQITSGTYNVTYRFLRRLAGSDQAILIRTIPNGEDGKFYIWDDYENIEITEDGLVYAKLNVNGDYFERGQELQVKNLKYQIDAISPSRTEVRLRAQNFDGLNYKEDFYRLAEHIRRSVSMENSVIEFIGEDNSDNPDLNSSNTLRITPTTGDFVFTPRMVNGTIIIKDVFLSNTIVTTPKSDLNFASNGGGEQIVLTDLGYAKSLADSFQWDANLHANAIEVQHWSTGFLSYLNKPTSIWGETIGIGYFAHWVQNEGKDGGVCMKFPDINQEYEQTIEAWPVGEPHRPLLINQAYFNSLESQGVSHGDNIIVSFDLKSSLAGKPVRVTSRYPDEALTEPAPTSPPEGYYDPNDDAPTEEIPPTPEGYIGLDNASDIEAEPPSRYTQIISFYDIANFQAELFLDEDFWSPGTTTAAAPINGAGVWVVESIQEGGDPIFNWEVNEQYSGFNTFHGLVSDGGEWVWDGINGEWNVNPDFGNPFPESYSGTVSPVEFPEALNAHPYTPVGSGIPFYNRTSNVGQNAGWVTGTAVGEFVHLFKDDLVWKVKPNSGTTDDLEVFTFKQWLESGGYRSGNNRKLFIEEDGDSIYDQNGNGKPLDYHIFANGGYIQSVTRGFNSNELPLGFIVAFNDGLGTDKSNKIAELGRPAGPNLVRIRAVRNLNPALDEAIVTNNNHFEMTLRERDGDDVYEYFFIIANRVYQTNDGDGDFFSTNNEQFLEQFGSDNAFSEALNTNDHFKDFIGFEPLLMLEFFGSGMGQNATEAWSRHHHIPLNELQLVKKVKSDLSGIEANFNINEIFFEAGIRGNTGLELEYGVLNPAAINFNPNAFYQDPEIQPEFDWSQDPRKTGVLSPEGLWRWSGNIDTGWEYQGTLPIQYSYRRPAEPWIRTNNANEWERKSVSITVRDNWLLGANVPWSINFEGHDISGDTNTFGIAWIDNVDVRFEFVNQSTTEDVLKPYTAQIQTVSDDGLTITTNKTFQEVAIELADDDDNPAEAFLGDTSNLGVYNHYESEYIVFNPRELRTYMKLENRFFLTTNFRADKQSITEYPHGVIFKLYEPLPNDIQRFSEVTLVKEMADVSRESIKIVDFVPEETGDRVLRSPNLNNLESGIVRRTNQFKNEAEILTSDPNISEQLKNKFLSQSLDSSEINVDYSQYSNFSNFGSVSKRIFNFKYKLELIESYNTQSGSLENTSGSLKDIRKWESRINEVKNNFDDFEHYMYFQSSSFISSSIGQFYDNAWPKVSGTGTLRDPYVLAHTTSSQAKTWYNNAAISSSLYDEENLNKLSSLLPEHLKIDTNNELYLKFTDMIGQHFDNIWIYVKAMGDVFDRRESLDQGISKDLLYEVGKSLGWTLSDGTDLVELPRFATGAEVTGSSYSDYSAVAEKDMSREIWSRIINNMPFFLKHKGTVKALKGLINIYGIPSTILRVKEYGGPNVPNSDLPQFEISRKFTKALDFRGSQNVSTPWTGSITGTERKPDTIEFRFRAATGSNQILVEKQSANPSSSFYIRLKDNNSADNYGFVSFQLSGSDGLKEVSSSNLPIYDGDFYSVMLRRTSGSDSSNVSQSFELSVGKYDASRSKLNLFSAVTMSTDIAASSSFNFNYATDGTVFIGGSGTKPNVGVQFSGSIMEYRHWTETLGVKHFKNHISNPKAYEGNHQTSSYQNLVLRYSFNDDKNLSTDTVGIRDVSSTATPTTSGSHNGFTGNFFSNVVDETKTHIPSIGALRRVTNKVRIESNPIKEGETLQCNKRATKSSYDSSPNDSNKVGIFFAPTDVINNDIINSVGDLNFDNFLGDPRDTTELSYRGLRHTSDLYWKKYNAPNNFWDYIRLLKYYDQSLFPQLKKMIPARSKPTVGVLVEPNIFERPKVVMGRKPEFEDVSFTSSINLTDDVVELSGSYNTGLEASSFDAYTGEILVNSYETGSTNYKWTGSYDTFEATISEFKNNNFDLSVWQQLGSGSYVTSSITFGDEKPKEVHQPIISGSRIFGRNQKVERFYTSFANATKGVFSSSSFKEVDIDNLAEHTSARFNSFYRGVKNTESSTVDGGAPIEIVITSPTKLVTQKGGDSTLKTGDGIVPDFKTEGSVKGSELLKGKASGADTDKLIIVTPEQAKEIEDGNIPEIESKVQSKPLDVMKVIKSGGTKGKKNKSDKNKGKKGNNNK